ncbi:MAG: leucine-rich repeat domain-containing protein [Bacteroidaceae bacterium]|nr:leucine-rich repeat domain-containing protein [Bacteroidaceae bacterium]
MEQIIGKLRFEFKQVHPEGCESKTKMAEIVHITSDEEKALESVEIPEILQYNGINYTVVSIKGGGRQRYSEKINTGKRVTDKRRKDYGDFIYEEKYTYVSTNVFCTSGWSGYYTTIRYRYNNGDVKSIKLPKTLKYIGDYAFCNCKITSIVIPDGVIKIGEAAFEGCNLKEVTIPSSVKEIKMAAFAGSNSVILKIKNKEGAVKFGYNFVDSNDKVIYLGKGFFAKLFGK